MSLAPYTHLYLSRPVGFFNIYNITYQKKKTLLNELRVLDGWEEERALFDEEKLRKVIVISELEKTTLLEDISWRQKLRAQWLKEGDKSI